MEFWSDLSGIELSENEPVWLQALPFNKYSHPQHGTIEITPERAQRFADNFKNNVVGTDLDVDYDHKALRKDAAGWIKDVAVRTSEADPKRNGLWYLVDFTNEARQKIKEKAYRYFSAEFNNTFTHPVSNIKFTDVLRGGGLTNRPHLKDILPINLSELTDEQPKEGTVDIEKLRKQLNLPETATEDEVLAAVSELQANGDKPKDEKSGDNSPKEEGKDDKESASLSEGEEALVKLAETDPVIKFLLDDREATKAKLTALEEKQAKADVKAKLTELTEGAKFTLPPAALDEAIALSEDDTLTNTQLSEKFLGILSNVAKTGLVELGERGGAFEKATGSAKTLSEAVTAYQKEHSDADYATALHEVSAKNPELYDNYLTELTEV